MFKENWDVIYLSEDVINCFAGKIYWGLFYLISYCIVWCRLFLTSILFKQCQRVLRACQTNSQNGCQAVRWLPRSEYTEQVQNGDQHLRVCWSDSPTATTTPAPTITQKGKGEKKTRRCKTWHQLLGTNGYSVIQIFKYSPCTTCLAEN